MTDQSPFAFIVGAPRCGTTTLAGFLQQHPEVCFSAVKEPHFFSRDELDDLDEGQVRKLVDEEYLQRFFGQCSGTEKLRAEGSVTYLYTPERMAPILKLWPNAKFVIALRDPLAMLPSLHQRLLVTGDENITDFRKAWAKIEERARGKSIPRSAIDPRFLRYDEAGALGRNVERFLAAVGRERCHIILFDDLAGDPEGAYRGLCRFLGLDPWPGHHIWRQADQQELPHRLAAAAAQAPAQGSPLGPSRRKIPHSARRSSIPEKARRSPPFSPSASGCLTGTRYRPSASRSIQNFASRSSTECATMSSICRE